MNARTKFSLRIVITFIVMMVIAAVSWLVPFGERSTKKVKE